MPIDINSHQIRIFLWLLHFDRGISILLSTHSEEVTSASCFLPTYQANESLVRSSLALNLPLPILTANSINKLNWTCLIPSLHQFLFSIHPQLVTDECPESIIVLLYSKLYFYCLCRYCNLNFSVAGCSLYIWVLAWRPRCIRSWLYGLGEVT